MALILHSRDSARFRDKAWAAVLASLYQLNNLEYHDSCQAAFTRATTHLVETYSSTCRCVPAAHETLTYATVLMHHRLLRVHSSYALPPAFDASFAEA